MDCHVRLEQTLDILGPETTPDTKYDLLLDKGTFDAISLMEDFGPTHLERYLSATSEFLTDDGIFIIATCNWTQEEIIQHMAKCT